MNKEYIPQELKFKTDARASSHQIYQGNKYRITILTDRFFRFEYNENGIFSDDPSQIFWHRKQEKTNLHVIEDDINLLLETKYWKIKYKKNMPFNKDTLIIKNTSTTYKFGDKANNNLKGTARTLDESDGEIPLEDGLFSKDGFVIIDDSKSLIYKNSWLLPSEKEMDYYFFGYSNDFEKGLLDYYKVSGFTPLIPRYILGNWWSRYWNYNEEELLNTLDNFKEREIPLSVCVIDMDWHLTEIDPKYGNPWTGYTWDKNNFENPKEFLQKLKNRKLFNSLNLHPASGFRAYESCYPEVARMMGIDPKTEETVHFDVTNPRFMQAYFKVHHDFEKDGVDFWWIDWQQGSESKIKGLDPLWALNHYHFFDSKKDDSKRGFIFSRWSGLGGHRYPIGFSGDTNATWESYKFQPYFTQTATNAGFGWWSHDIGGHFNGKSDSELYTRWIQLGVFSPIMRLHSSKNYYNKREPWRYDSKIEEIVTSYLRFRHQLIPYIYTHAYYLSKGKLPLIRPLYYLDNQDKAYKYKSVYGFGSELIVSPYTNQIDSETNFSKQDIWLPKGTWYDFKSGYKFEGNKEYTIYGKLDEIGLFAKSGAIIPLAGEKDENHISLPKNLITYVFPFENNEFTLYEDDGISNQYLNEKSSFTKFILSVTNNGFTFKINEDDKLKLIPKDRVHKIIFRNISPNYVIEGIDAKQIFYNKVHNNLEVTLNKVENIKFTVSFANSIYANNFNLKEVITKYLDHTSFLIEDLTKIGFYEEIYKVHAWGLINDIEDIELLSKKINKLDISNKLKELVNSLIELAKIN